RLGAPHEEKVYKTAKLHVEGARLPFKDAWQVIAKLGLSDQVAWPALPWWLNNAYGDYYAEGDCEWDEETGQEACDRGAARRLPGAVDTDSVSVPNATPVDIKVADGKDWSVVQAPLATS